MPEYQPGLVICLPFHFTTFTTASIRMKRWRRGPVASPPALHLYRQDPSRCRAIRARGVARAQNEFGVQTYAGPLPAPLARAICLRTRHYFFEASDQIGSMQTRHRTHLS